MYATSGFANKEGILKAQRMNCIMQDTAVNYTVCNNYQYVSISHKRIKHALPQTATALPPEHHTNIL